LIALVGRAGYIGSQLSSVMVKMNIDHIVIDDLSSGRREFLDNRVNFTKISVLNTKELTECFIDRKVTLVVHLAALKSVEASVSNGDDFYKVNTLGTSSLLKAVRSAGISDLIFSSTAAVYGVNLSGGELKENHLLEPISPYGDSKKQAEELIVDASKEWGLKFVVFRYFNVAGKLLPIHYPSEQMSLLPIIQRSVENRSLFTIFGNDYKTKDGTCTRDFIHISDLISAKLKAIEHLQMGGSSEVLNLGSGTKTTILDVVKIFEMECGGSVQYSYGPRRQGDPEFSLADISKSKKILRWEPMLSINEIIRDYV